MTKAILLDIEGTTTPIDFVHKTLFPFAKERIGDFVRENFVAVAPEISQLGAEHTADSEYSADLDANSPESVAAYLEFLIDRDRKSTPLKSLQGKIWKEGYEKAALKSVVFDDVPRALERWKSEGKTIAIYSSGSVLAQRLLFRHTNHGDLTALIDTYFDTNIGGKKEKESYQKIARELGLEPSEILFVSDVAAELKAAREAGMQTAFSMREGNAAVTDKIDHSAVNNFDDL